MLSLTEDVWQQMVGHAYDGLPDEACGLLAGDPATGGAASVFYPCRNAAGVEPRSTRSIRATTCGPTATPRAGASRSSG